MHSRIKKRCFQIVEVATENDIISKIFDIIIISLIALNVVIVIADTFNVPDIFKSIMDIIEIVSVVVFSAEYLVRLWTADLAFPQFKAIKARVRFIFSGAAIIDLVALLPFYVPFLLPVNLVVLRVFRVFRLMRLFKVNRYTHALATIGEVFKRKSSQLISSLLVVGLLMIIASVLMYNVEHDVQPEVFENALSGLWWAVATLTTVGYGDIYPITPIGKVLSAIIALLGIGLVAVPTGIISAGFAEQIEQAEQEDEEKCYCPYCGKKIK